MCDKDALVNIETSIAIGKKVIKTGPVFYSLWISNSLSETDRNRLARMESKIQPQSARKEMYPDSLFEELREIASKGEVFVLPSDFEGIFERDGYGTILREAKKISKSKVIRGRFVAEQIADKNDAIPKEFRDVINRITQM